MIHKTQLLLLLLLLITTLPFLHTTSSTTQTCGNNHVPYPFGFSTTSKIPLTCTPTLKILAGNFPINSITPNEILIHLQTQCNRSITTLKHLFPHNFAPTTTNGILLQNCPSPISCPIPDMQIMTNFQSKYCDNYSNPNNNISCFSTLDNTTNFLTYTNILNTGCKSLLSAISADTNNNSTLSLEVEVVRLGWWLDGKCNCSKGAKCTEFISPKTHRPAFRCQCKDGFVGDGFHGGLGCRRKESLECNSVKYFSGHCGKSARISILVGGIMVGTSMMISLGLICCFIRRRSSLRARTTTKQRFPEPTITCSIPIYSYKQIERATNNFSESQRLGTGAYGTVYSGKLHDDQLVAIKRIKHHDTESIDQVMNEIRLLSSVSHPNLLRLLGCSIEYGEQILIYEFMPNGTLCQHLQKKLGNGLPWLVRLTVATETAQAISYLHSVMNPPIYHRDIKSSNILLDHNLKAKVADFGLSRLAMTDSSHISTAPQGTPGYVDPQYHQDYHLSDKSDVYSFGVVLLEIITALNVVDFSRPQSDVNLAALGIDRIGKGCFDDIIDPFLEPNRDSWTLLSIHKVAELAFRCLSFHRDMRPLMTEVANELEQVLHSRFDSTFEGVVCEGLSNHSSSSSSSNGSEKPLNVAVMKSKPCFVNSDKDHSPVSVEDSWLSGGSSLSSNSLLG